MKKDNEAKMKEILNDLEDDYLDEKTKEVEFVEEKEQKNEEVVEEEFDKSSEEETNKNEEVEVSEKTQNEEVEETIDEIEDISNEDDAKETKEVEEDTENSKEEIEEDNEDVVEDESADENDEDITNKQFKESPIKIIGDYLVAKLRYYRYVLILDVIVFLFLFFLIPTIILDVKPVMWMTLFLVFTILPTITFYAKNLFKKYQIMLGLPFIYICILCVLDSCTLKDLYGITSHGVLDKTPAMIDAVLVTFIIVFFQYIGLTVVDLCKKLFKKNKKKAKK